MNSFNVFKVSASALEAQRQRMNVVASNMANVHSTRTDEGGPYRRKDVLFSAETVQSDSDTLTGVRIVDVVADSTPFRTVYDPGHPDADKDGYVSMPNINIIEEMVNIMMASRAYEASVSAFNMSKAMFLKTLELGRQ